MIEGGSGGAAYISIHSPRMGRDIRILFLRLR